MHATQSSPHPMFPPSSGSGSPHSVRSTYAVFPFMWMLFLQSPVEQSNFEISVTSRSLVSIGGRQHFSLLYTKALDFVDAEIDAVTFSSFDRGIDT